MPYVGVLQSAGFAKESSIGTAVTPPTDFVPYIPPETFSPAITALESKGIYTLPDAVVKVTQGPAEIKGAKIKYEMNPETIGHHLMAALGTDTAAEVASYVVVTGTNDKIDFVEDGGSEVTATLTAGTYIMGASSSVAGSLCALIKAQMEAVNGSDTYTVTYSTTTKKLTITKSAGVFVIKWHTGTNAAKNAKTLLGFTDADTSSAIAQTSDSTTTTPVFQHTFTRLANAQLPTYTYWFKKATEYPYFSGAMLSKLTIEAKAKEYVTADCEFTALKYEGNDAGGGSVSIAQPQSRPFVFQNAQLSVAGSPSLDYDNMKVEIDNMVNAEHVLTNDIYAKKIWSEGMRVTIAADLYFENATEYTKFINGTETSFQLVLTHIDDISGAATGNKYSLTITLPKVTYLTAPFNNPQGVIKIPFTAVARYDLGTSTNSITAVLKNGHASAY